MFGAVLTESAFDLLCITLRAFACPKQFATTLSMRMRTKLYSRSKTGLTEGVGGETLPSPLLSNYSVNSAMYFRSVR